MLETPLVFVSKLHGDVRASRHPAAPRLSPQSPAVSLHRPSVPEVICLTCPRLPGPRCSPCQLVSPTSTASDTICPRRRRQRTTRPAAYFSSIQRSWVGINVALPTIQSITSATQRATLGRRHVILSSATSRSVRRTCLRRLPRSLVRLRRTARSVADFISLTSRALPVLYIAGRASLSKFLTVLYLLVTRPSHFIEFNWLVSIRSISRRSFVESVFDVPGVHRMRRLGFTTQSLHLASTSTLTRVQFCVLAE